MFALKKKKKLTLQISISVKRTERNIFKLDVTIGNSNMLQLIKAHPNKSNLNFFLGVDR